MGGSPGTADVTGAARIEGEANRNAAQEALWGSRPNQTNPFGSTTYTATAVDASTGQPIVQLANGQWVPQSWAEGEGADRIAYDQERARQMQAALRNPRYDHMSHSELGRMVERDMASAGFLGQGASYGGPKIDNVTQWEQENVLNDEWQGVLDAGRGQLQGEIDYRTGVVADWEANPTDFSMYGGDNLQGTIGRDALGQFGQTQTTTGAQDWRQFGTTNPQITGDDWRQFGTTNPQITGDDWRQFGNTQQTINAGDHTNYGYSDATIGQDDWRQFGTTDTNLQSGDYDARFGGASDAYRDEFGDHDMGGSDWDTIQYAPDAIRRQAEQQTLDFMNSQLDPQWDQRQEQLEIQLANQGLQWGDAAYDNAMASMKRSRDTAYSGARNQALADSRSEAAMLWDQEMGRSEQVNRQLQMDTDNEYRARQSNISNYLSGRETDVYGNLAYQNAAFDQDLRSRQQQLDADLGYGRESFNQDYMGREQALNQQLAYGREAWNQDFSERNRQTQANLQYGQAGFDQDLRSRQQQLDANRLYNQQAFDQDRTARQDNITNYLNYGNAEFNQNLQAQELGLTAAQYQEMMRLQQYQAADPNATMGTITSALGG